jgi:hypothetical protein
MTNRDSLLLAALLCGMHPGGPSVHRYQLFFVINGKLRRRVGANVLQRALETATEEGFFAKPNSEQDGRYQITERGYQHAVQVHGPLQPELAPAPRGGCRFSLTSPSLHGHHMQLTITDGTIQIDLDGEHTSGTAALAWLNENIGARIPVSKDSHARRVYDYGIANDWILRWQGESAAPTADVAELQSRVVALRRMRRGGRPMPAPSGNRAPERSTVTVAVWRRDPAVVEHVLNRANGRCELCDASPFLAASGETFLEVHHVRTLADGGPDTVDNAVALCPNCHRALHYAADRDARRETLYQRVEALLQH